ncbi:MAG: hypothetical protein AAGC53_11270 [Actinomycetota bacterium]
MSDQLTMPHADELAEMLSTVLSGFTFPEAAIPEPDAQPFGARLVIEGDAEVGLYVEADPVAAPALAEAFFATGQPTEQDKTEAVMELANIAAGAIKTLLGGEGEWSIGIPDSGMPESFDGWTVTQASAGGGHIHLAFLPA